MYKYLARKASIDFDFMYASLLYKMAFYSQENLQTMLKNQEPNTWSIYFKGISKICYSLSLLANENYELNQIIINLENGINLLNLYKSRIELENDVHDDKLLIVSYANTILIILKYGNLLKKYSRVLYFLPDLVKRLFFFNKHLSNYRIDEEIIALSQFEEKYNEIPSLVDEKFLTYLKKSLLVIKEHDKKYLRSYKEIYERVLSEFNNDLGNEWKIDIVKKINSIIIPSYKDDILIRKLNVFTNQIEWLAIFLFIAIQILKRLNILEVRILLESINSFLDLFLKILVITIFVIELFFKGIFKEFSKGKKK